MPKSVIICADSDMCSRLYQSLSDVLRNEWVTLVTDMRILSSCGSDLEVQFLFVQLGLLEDCRTMGTSIPKSERLIALCSNPGHKNWCRARELGADIVVDERGSSSELMDGLKTLGFGGSQLYPKLISSPDVGASSMPTQQGQFVPHMEHLKDIALDALTDRQKAVLHRLGLGESNRIIGYRLGISENTVRLHVSAILKCLKVSNRTAAALLRAKPFNDSF